MANRTCSVDDCDRTDRLTRGWCGKHYTRWYRHGTPTVERTPFDLSPEDAAWIAGLFEGEGCISLEGRHRVTLIVHMTDRDVIQRLSDLTTQEPPRQRPPSDPNHLDTWIWQVGWRPDIEELLTTMLPWLGERRSVKALEALEHLEGQTQDVQKRLA